MERFVANRFRVGQRVSCLWDSGGDDGGWYDARVVEVFETGDVGVQFDGFDDDEGYAVVGVGECRERARKDRSRRTLDADVGRPAFVPPEAKGSPLDDQRRSLPAYDFRTRILSAIHSSRVTVVDSVAHERNGGFTVPSHRMGGGMTSKKPERHLSRE